MRALVTGGGGFSGRHLVAQLEAAAVEVHTVGARALPRAHHHHVDLLGDRPELQAVVTKIAPDRVYHLAGVSHASDPLAYYRVNLGAASALLGALEAAGYAMCPTLLVGTSAEYGQVGPGDLPIQEALPARPYGHYGVSKLAQTIEGLAAARSGRPVVLVRPFNLIGPGMPRHLVVPAFARQLAEVVRGGRPPVIEVGNLDPTRDFLHVADAVAAYRALLERPEARGQVVNVCSGVGTSIRDLLEGLIRLSGASVEVRTTAGLVKQVDVPAHYGSVSRLHGLIGTPVLRSLEAILREVLDDALGAP